MTQKEYKERHCRKCKAPLVGDTKTQDGLCKKCKKGRNRNWRSGGK